MCIKTIIFLRFSDRETVKQDVSFWDFHNKINEIKKKSESFETKLLDFTKKSPLKSAVGTLALK